MEDFGIIVTCCASDYLFAKGCCASIRYFLGDIPICLLIDGNFSAQDAEKTYGVRVLNRSNITNPFLRKRSFGWGITKMVAFWESPWKHFLMLDADTIVWGNLLKYANFYESDIIIDRPKIRYTNDLISKYFFEISKLEQHFPDFKWQAHRYDYYCTGTFFGTRNSFSLSEYQEILDFLEKEPEVFKYGEMGFLNFMIFRAADEGRIRLGQEDMQLLVPDFDQEHVRKRFPIEENREPILSGEEATVVHWCGAEKPTVSNSKIYSEPMSFFRRKFLRDSAGVTGGKAEVLLQVEDWQRLIKVYQGKGRRWLAKKRRSKVSNNR